MDLAAFRAEMTADRWLAWQNLWPRASASSSQTTLRFIGNWRVLRQRDLLDIQMEARPRGRLQDRR